MKSVCNTLYHNSAPFKLTGSCAGFAGYNKPQDIGHLWSRYPGEPPGAPDDVQCTNPYCAMYLEGW